jgi:hypothetical protein|tara:strand:+ start:191 stop:340 length:150 start_codon:yes stop_codon:yes gene_type:complete
MNTRDIGSSFGKGGLCGNISRFTRWWVWNAPLAIIAEIIPKAVLEAYWR